MYSNIIYYLYYIYIILLEHYMTWKIPGTTIGIAGCRTQILTMLPNSNTNNFIRSRLGLQQLFGIYGIRIYIVL